MNNFNKKYPKYLGKESNFQISAANLLNSLGLLWFHAPNGGSRHYLEAKNLKAQGVKAGVPDIIVLTPNDKYKGIAIELKVGYNKPSEEQLKWLQDLNNLGFYTLVSYSLDEVIDVVEAYVKNKL